ncbi:MAG: hypothetical protein HC806_05125 [Anaerolineae bacterium]|nr:hypothetical protein [Anaerolineae bacterium]
MKFLTRSLFARLVSYFLLTALVATTVLPFLTFTYARNAMEQLVLERLSAAVSLKEGVINRWVADRQQDIFLLSELPELVTSVEVLAQTTDQDLENREAYTFLSSYFQSVIARKNDFAEIFILADVGGEILLSTEPEREGEFRVTDSYFTQGRLGAYVQNIYTSPHHW